MFEQRSFSHLRKAAAAQQQLTNGGKRRRETCLWGSIVKEPMTQTVEKSGDSLWKHFSRYTPRRLSVLPVRQVALLDMVPERTPCPPA